MFSYWQDYKERMMQLARPILSQCKEQFEILEGQVKYKQYAKGGLTTPRGFYCPSLVYDKVIGNINRGKLYKRLLATSVPDYEYGFSEDGKLITVISKNNTREFIIRTENAELGICKYADPNLDFLYSLIYCEYENSKITHFCCCDFRYDKMDQCWFERYGYENECVASVDILTLVGYQINYVAGNLSYRLDPVTGEWLLLSNKKEVLRHREGF